MSSNTPNFEIYDGLTLSGGGSKGIIMLGILHYHIENKLIDLNKINYYSGTSVGAVINLLLVCGYTPMEIYQKLSIMDSFFVENSNYTTEFDSKQSSETNTTGIMSSDGLKNIISSLVKKKLNVSQTPTLLELYKLKGKYLYMCATNTTNKTEEKISHETYPHLDCAEGATMSSSIPVFFKARKYQNNVFADGGVVNNLPWDYISDSATNILAIHLGTAAIQFPEDSSLGYIYNLIMTPVHRLTQLRKDIAPKNVKIIECIWECSFLHMVLSKEQKWKMFLFGYHSAKRFYESENIYVNGWKNEIIRKKNIYSQHPADGWDFGDEI